MLASTLSSIAGETKRVCGRREEGEILRKCSEGGCRRRARLTSNFRIGGHTTANLIITCAEAHFDSSPTILDPAKSNDCWKVGQYAIQSCLLFEYVPQDLIRVSLLLQSDCRHVAAQLMVKLVQSFEGVDLLSSCQIEAKASAMNRELAGNKGEKNLFVGVWQCQYQLLSSSLFTPSFRPAHVLNVA